MGERENQVTVPYIVHEGEMARKERTEKRLWVVIIILILALVGSNAGWIWYESQWEEVTTTTYEQQADGDSSNYIVGGDFNVSPTESDNH